MSNHASTADPQVPWKKLLIWGVFLLVIYYLRELFRIVFITFLMSYMIGNIVAALKNRIAPGRDRPWLDRGLTESTMKHIRTLKDRCLKVRFLTNSLAANNHTTAFGGCQKQRKQQIDALTELFEYRPDATSQAHKLEADAAHLLTPSSQLLI